MTDPVSKALTGAVRIGGSHKTRRAPKQTNISLMGANIPAKESKVSKPSVAKFRIARNGNTSCGGILLLGDSTKPSLDLKP